MGDDRADVPLPPRSGRIPLAVPCAFTLFMAVLVPFYWDYYGPANFLWICDLALMLTVVALWGRSPFLASMALVATLLPSLIWLADFVTRIFTGAFLTGWTSYMFRPDVPLVIRGLSLFHVWFPFLLLWVVGRLGYDSRGWLAQTALTWAVLPVCYFFTDPARALNGVFGPSGARLQTWMAPGLWLALMMLAYPLLVYGPTHLVLRRLVRAPGPPQTSAAAGP